MNNKNIFVILCIALCLGIFVSNAHAADSTSVKPMDLQGYDDFIAKNKGKIVLVNFFATWCPPCRVEIPDLVKVADDMADNVVVIGLSVDETVGPVKKFVKDMGVQYPVFKVDMQVARKFMVQTIPHNLVYNKAGKIVANAAGVVTEEELKRFITMLLEEENNASSDNS